MATHATVPSPHLEGSAADRSTHPTPRADLRAKHEPQQQKKSPQRLQEGHTRTAITVFNMALRGLSISQKETALSVSKRLVLRYQISSKKGNKVIFDIPVIL